MADKVTYAVEVDDYTKGSIVGTLSLEIGSRDGAVFVRLVDAGSMTLAGTMNAEQVQAMVEGLQKAIQNIS